MQWALQRGRLTALPARNATEKMSNGSVRMRRTSQATYSSTTQPLLRHLPEMDRQWCGYRGTEPNLRDGRRLALGAVISPDLIPRGHTQNGVRARPSGVRKRIEMPARK